MGKWALGLGGLYGAMAVLFGAFGAHALAGTLDARGEKLWSLASHYALCHAAALVALGAWLAAAEVGPARPSGAVAIGMLAAGTFLFSGSLYALALGAPKAIGIVTPVGGLALVAGWLLAAWRAWP